MSRKKKVTEAKLEKLITECYDSCDDNENTLLDEDHIVKYGIESRYEAWFSTGKQFTKWFKLTLNEFSTQEEANEFIVKYKHDSVNPKMHLKEEFRIVQE